MSVINRHFLFYGHIALGFSVQINFKIGFGNFIDKSFSTFDPKIFKLNPNEH